jgi:hypothetical protein
VLVAVYLPVTHLVFLETEDDVAGEACMVPFFVFFPSGRGRSLALVCMCGGGEKKEHALMFSETEVQI